MVLRNVEFVRNFVQGGNFTHSFSTTQVKGKSRGREAFTDGLFFLTSDKLSAYGFVGVDQALHIIHCFRIDGVLYRQ